MPLLPTRWIWLNGSMVPWDEASVHVMTYALHMGASIFEGIRCYDTPRGPAVFRLREHVRRLSESARVYRMELPWSVPQVMDACRAVIRENGLKGAYLRPLAWLGQGELGTNPMGHPVEMMIGAFEWGAYLGAEGLENGVDVCVSSWRRLAPGTIPSMAKAGGSYLSSQLISREARTNGFAEGIALDAHGYLSEGSAENLFVVRDRVLFTPPVSAAILPGITRDAVITLARHHGYEVREQMLPREMLYVADELFFTGTAAEVTPIRSVDRIQVGNGTRGPVTALIQESFFAIARGQAEDRWGWLSHVAPKPVPATRAPREPVVAQRGQPRPPLSTETPSTTAPATLVHDLFAAIDARDFERLRDICHPEVVYERPGYEPFSGVERLLKFYREERVIASGGHALTAVVIDARHAACWGRFVGTHRNGTAIDVEFADTYELQDGMIRRRKSFFYEPSV